MFHGFLAHGKKRSVENRMNFPPRGDVETESCVEDDFFDIKGTGLFHLELFGSIHVKIGHFKPDLISCFPGQEFGRYPFLHFLLGHFVGGLCYVWPG